mmetsp:Transcript_94658/g.165318  ORF Transcript_94658/g.165318 Transcript_94658/m.165318 type:complete len:435 (-) Transcript_94658:126-1430(-)
MQNSSIAGPQMTSVVSMLACHGIISILVFVLQEVLQVATLRNESFGHDISVDSLSVGSISVDRVRVDSGGRFIADSLSNDLSGPAKKKTQAQKQKEKQKLDDAIASAKQDCERATYFLTVAEAVESKVGEKEFLEAVTPETKTKMADLEKWEENLAIKAKRDCKHYAGKKMVFREATEEDGYLAEGCYNQNGTLVFQGRKQTMEAKKKRKHDACWEFERLKAASDKEKKRVFAQCFHSKGVGWKCFNTMKMSFNRYARVTGSIQYNADEEGSPKVLDLNVTDDNTVEKIGEKAVNKQMIEGFNTSGTWERKTCFEASGKVTAGGKTMCSECCDSSKDRNLSTFQVIRDWTDIDRSQFKITESLKVQANDLGNYTSKGATWNNKSVDVQPLYYYLKSTSSHYKVSAKDDAGLSEEEDAAEQEEEEKEDNEPQEEE